MLNSVLKIHLLFSISTRLPLQTTMDAVAIPLMDLAPGNLIYRQLETSLQLFILLSSTMLTGEILTARIRLTEANILLGEMMTQ